MSRQAFPFWGRGGWETEGLWAGEGTDTRRKMQGSGCPELGADQPFPPLDSQNISSWALVLLRGDQKSVSLGIWPAQENNPQTPDCRGGPVKAAGPLCSEDSFVKPVCTHNFPSAFLCLLSNTSRQWGEELGASMENREQVEKATYGKQTIEQEQNTRAIADVFRGIKREIASIKQV